MDDLRHFARDFDDSRDRFLKRVHALAHAQPGRCPVPSRTDLDLTVDHVFLPATSGDAKFAFVITSGLHGIEAYAGTAVQSMFLEELLPRLDRRRASFLIVHAMNPYGFRHHRRGTETNVNLNRNFGADGISLYKIENRDYLRVRALAEPPGPVTSLTSPLLASIRREGERIFFGEIEMDDFVRAVGPGQFQSPDGLEFGGFGPEPQTSHLIRLLKEHLSGAPNVVLFDLHTGLGDRLQLHLIPGDHQGCVDPELKARLFPSAEDRDICAYTESDQDGFYRTDGDLNSVFPDLLANDQKRVALTLEYGTIGHDLEAQLESLNRWMIENQGLAHGYATPELEREARARFAAKFAPLEDEWRRNVVFRARELFLRVFQRAGLLTRPR